MAANSFENDLKKWLEKHYPDKVTNQSIESSSDSNNTEKLTLPRQNSPQPSTSAGRISTNQINTNQSNDNVPLSLSSKNEINKDELKIFENDTLSLFIYKARHQRQKRFQFQDALFHIRCELKDKNNPPLLRDLLNVFQESLTFMLNHLKTYFNLAEHNFAYLTLFQEPLVNGLNTGAFDIEDDASSLVDRLLGMLNSYLISNQNLELNNTFKIYVNVLSLDKDHFKKYKQKIPKKRNLNYGARTKRPFTFNQYWALDIPFYLSENVPIFKNACFLIAVVIGYLQNAFFETKDLRYKYVEDISSSNLKKQNKAVEILKKELDILKNNLNIITDEPININDYLPQIHELYQCQIFIFSGLYNSTQLKLTFPSVYDDSLKPIFIFETNENSNHVVFIKHINSFFRHFKSTCLACKKMFKSAGYRHLCKIKKTCFACRRFFACETTYLNSRLEKNFCLGHVINNYEKKIVKFVMLLYFLMIVLNCINKFVAKMVY